MLVPVGQERTAVIPREHEGYAETAGLAALLSRTLGCPVMTFVVFDSDPRGLTVAYRHAGDVDLPGAQRVGT